MIQINLAPIFYGLAAILGAVLGACFMLLPGMDDYRYERRAQRQARRMGYTGETYRAPLDTSFVSWLGTAALMFSAASLCMLLISLIWDIGLFWPWNQLFSGFPDRVPAEVSSIP